MTYLNVLHFFYKEIGKCALILSVEMWRKRRWTHKQRIHREYTSFGLLRESSPKGDTVPLFFCDKGPQDVRNVFLYFFHKEIQYFQIASDM